MPCRKGSCRKETRGPGDLQCLKFQIHEHLDQRQVSETHGNPSLESKDACGYLEDLTLLMTVGSFGFLFFLFFFFFFLINFYWSIAALECCAGFSCSVAKSYATLCAPMDCSPPGFSVHGVFQARILEWVAVYFSGGSSLPRDQTHVSCLSRWTPYL